MTIHSVEIQVPGGQPIKIETGKYALLANGSVVVSQGETSVIVNVCSADPRPGIDFFPLQVDYREKFAAAGRIPGGFFKREGRPSEKEILTCRMTDRPLRPLFPKGFIDEVQIQGLLLSADGIHEADTLLMLGASASLVVSDIPFGGPAGAIRVGRVNGEFVANPTISQMAESDIDLVYAGVAGKTIMIEGAADECSEEDLRDAFIFADQQVCAQADALNKLRELAGKPKYTPKTLNLMDEDIDKVVSEATEGKFEPVFKLGSKNERGEAMNALRDEILASVGESLVTEERSEDAVKSLVGSAVDLSFKRAMRNKILKEGVRLDGRGLKDLRPLEAEIGLLPRVHGTGLFTRGETQVLVTTTLGTTKDGQESDALTGGETTKHFLLHYNFPNFSVGEVGRIMGPGRREIGHGALAERSVERMMPKVKDGFPYTVRCVSEVMASNGSTSMGSICAASLALMHAGVPLKKHVAGISTGLVTEGDEYVMMTDIQGIEDHYGDMDFKVAGSPDGITGFQLDLKTPGITIDQMYEAMLINKEARVEIHKVMSDCVSEPATEISADAPQIHTLQIKPEKIGALIGPGGSVIREITAENDVEIDIDDDGTVKIYATGRERMQAGIAAVEAVVAEVEVGQIYRGTVVNIREFGAFVEIFPGQQGLLHISELADYRVKSVEDIVSEGDKVTVKCIDIDDRGRIRLSRKAALNELEE
ncbi:MAG: polyribonucleotide nucleotidyltransferase [Lentisphaeria bacterium]|nr:polyribonucleotide nucleotidyltransferase [Lentisphaeria bacterium]